MKIHSGSILSKQMEKIDVMKEKQTPWRAIYIAVFFLIITGAQVSVYFMSTMPYLQTVYKEATVQTFGYVVSAGSLGTLITAPIFGYWQQKTNSTKQPVIFGFLLAALGNVLYAFCTEYGSAVFVLVLIARFLAGFGSGTLGVLKSYIAVSSTPRDRSKAVSLGNGGFTVGLSLGPIIQICFIPLGSSYFKLTFFVINMYTACAFFMAAVCIFGTVLVYTILEENYVGIVTKNEKAADSNLIIPKSDKLAVLICFYIWFCLRMLNTTIEGIAVPLTIAMYGWNNSQSILYNGILMMGCGISSTIISMALAFTRLGKINSRFQMMFGQVLFCLIFVFYYPWSFYGSKLSNPKLVNGVENLDEIGGCSRDYSWCSTTTAIPLAIYVIFYICGLGVAFPTVSAPVNTLFSEILGPRKQGFMQGLLCLNGSTAQFITPIIITAIFNAAGFRYIMLYHFGMFLIGSLLILVFFKRLVPLRVFRKKMISSIV